MGVFFLLVQFIIFPYKFSPINLEVFSPAQADSHAGTAKLEIEYLHGNKQSLANKCPERLQQRIFLKENFKTICRYFLSRLSLRVHFQAHGFCTHQVVFRRPISRTMFAFIFTNCGRLFSDGLFDSDITQP